MLVDGLKLARVVKLHPADPSADVVYMDDAWPSPRVPIGLPGMTSNAGTFDLPVPDEIADESGIGSTEGRVMIAVVSFFKGYPFIQSFLPPAVCEMLFAEPNRYVKRFPSDVVVTADDAGNVEVWHPSGTYFRLGETTAHDDLTGRDVNKRFKIRRNTGRQVHACLVVANGGEEKGRVAIDPAGNGVLDLKGTLQASSEGDASVSAPRVTVAASVSVTLDTPRTECTGSFHAAGLISSDTNVGVGPILLVGHKHPTAAPGAPSPAIP